MSPAAPAWPGPRRIAHRGGGTLAPENTLAAIRVGIAHGYRGVEFDVMLTADDVPVLMHDPAFGRTIAGSGSVATTRFADLAQRDAGAWFAERFRGEPVPRFADVSTFCRAHDIWMNVEIKASPGTDSRTGQVVGETIAALWAHGETSGWPLVSSFSSAALEAVRTAAPHVPRGLLFHRAPADAIDLAIDLGCTSVHVDHRWLEAPFVARLHHAGLSVMAYTVDDPARGALLDQWGVDALCVDRVDLIGRR